MQDYEPIFNEAREAASKAAIAKDKSLPPENARGFDCGFGWVEFRPATHPFIRWCKAQIKKIDDIEQASGLRDVKAVRAANDYNRRKFGSKHSTPGWTFWNPGGHGTQSIDVHRAGAEAFVAVLDKHGITGGRACSWLD